MCEEKTQILPNHTQFKQTKPLICEEKGNESQTIVIFNNFNS